jgi:hypothetical protein
MSATKIAAAFERWHKLWTTTYPTDAKSNAARARRHPLEREIVQTRASALPDVLAKVRMLREIEKGGTWSREDEMLASVIADLEQLAPTVSPALAALIDAHRDLRAVRAERYAVVKRGFPAAGKERDDADAAVGNDQDEKEMPIEEAIASFEAQSLADIAAKCVFVAKESNDGNFELAQAAVEAVTADAERLAGKGGAA